MPGLRVSFRFQGELNDFLASGRRNTEFDVPTGTTDTIKHVIESIGVPHTEIGRVMVNGAAVSTANALAEGDRVEVFPHEQPIVLNVPKFVLDGHLGRLAAYLRMLGFDTWYDRFADDAQLAKVASTEGRVLLTRDVGLLKRREIERGYSVRHHKPHDQLKEVSRRFALHSSLSPFRRCMDCNGDLQPIAKEQVADLLPPHTRQTKDEFSRCASCAKIFWRGSHYVRMSGWIENLMAESGGEAGTFTPASSTCQ